MSGEKWLLKVDRKFRANGPIRLKRLRKTSMEERTRGSRSFAELGLIENITLYSR
jgi:hypothetical protein